jgi:hypothetical protein
VKEPRSIWARKRWVRLRTLAIYRQTLAHRTRVLFARANRAVLRNQGERGDPVARRFNAMLVTNCLGKSVVAVSPHSMIRISLLIRMRRTFASVVFVVALLVEEKTCVIVAVD